MTERQMELIGELFGKYEKSLYRYVSCRLQSGNRAMAEDIVQSTFEKLMENVDKLDLTDELQVKKYLVTVAHNLSCNVNRNNRKLCKVESEIEERIFLIERCTAEDFVYYQALLSIIYKLNERYAKVVILRGVCGMSFFEIGNIMGEKEATVRQWMNRARKLIKNSEEFSGWI